MNTTASPSVPPASVPSGLPVAAMPAPTDIAITSIPAPPTTAPQSTGIDLSATLLETRNVKQASDRHAKAKQTAIDIRKLYWPEVKDEDLWLLTDRKRGGFAQVPRTLSIVMNIINCVFQPIVDGISG